MRVSGALLGALRPSRLGRDMAVFSFAALLIAAPSNRAAAETRSYVISLFTQAVYSQDDDCPGGPEPNIEVRFRGMLADMGKSPEEVDALMADFNGGGGSGAVHEILRNRGSPPDRRVFVGDNPTQVPDPKIRTVISKIGPGFDLDGKVGPESFVDPETGQTGIDNQYFRALGCFVSHRALPPNLPTVWSYAWDATRDRTKGWVIAIDGEDLDKDGPVTVTFARAMETPIRTPQGMPQRDQTFRIDPTPRYINTLREHMKDGVLTIEPAPFHIVTGGGYLPLEMRLTQTQMRLKPKPDGSVEGMMGGYQPWLEIYYMYAGGGYGYESMVGLNLPGIYYALRRLADAEPDPKTGQNMSISTAYRFEAVPALVVNPARTARAGR
jgi:hypothetical protein